MQRVLIIKIVEKTSRVLGIDSMKCGNRLLEWLFAQCRAIKNQLLCFKRYARPRKATLALQQSINSLITSPTIMYNIRLLQTVLAAYRGKSVSWGLNDVSCTPKRRGPELETEGSGTTGKLMAKLTRVEGR